ncbi:transcriptional regulator [Phytomonospora sp. NPDC050363]|uniref:transcriptional regulator n=1 Tax=Phytomonospora sp. NPDC050363 TaxID=3155642 RepID=UPI0033F9385D
MTRQSPTDLRILHAVRLLGFADDTAIATRAAASPDEVAEWLRTGEGQGWVQQFAFADLRGWSLSETGKAENERRLAEERAEADPERRIEEVYREFLPLNARLLKACTDWQMKPGTDGRLTTNRHEDKGWDEQVLEELRLLSEELDPLVGRLRGVLARFAGYDLRFERAWSRARAGETEWVDKSDVDSCHRVWFQLHEDLVATLGVDRSEEGRVGAG